MSDQDISFKGPGGADPQQHLLTVFATGQPTQVDVLYAGQRQRSRIVQRTLSGRDYNDVPFAPYSEAYARRKSKAGHSSTVNLFGMENHPHMLNRIMVVAPTPDLLQLSFQGEEAVRARMHNEGGELRRVLKLKSGKGKRKKSSVVGHMPKRTFFRASDSDLAAMSKDVAESTNRRLGGV